jgi:hypothetical protein
MRIGLAARVIAGVAVAISIACLIFACGGGTAPAAPSAVVVAKRTVTVNVALQNNLNNAVQSDITIQVTIGNVTTRFRGGATAWVNTATNVLSSTSYNVEAVNVPDDYRTSTCAGDLSGDVNCTITLTDTLTAPGCDAALIKFLYRPKRFEGLRDDGTPIPRCETTWGIVRGSEAEHDADAETWVQPTKTEVRRLFSANHDNFNASKSGWLVGEWICRGAADAIGVSQGMTTHCDNYRKYVAGGQFLELPLPAPGDSGVFVGFLVYDCGHGCWTELHPLTWWHKLLHPLTPDRF